jgi:hypothetical protein
MENLQAMSNTILGQQDEECGWETILVVGDRVVRLVTIFVLLLLFSRESDHHTIDTSRRTSHHFNKMIFTTFLFDTSY